MRLDGRESGQIRKVKITRNYLKHPEGSVLIEMGDTLVICTASVEETVPPHCKGKGSGWVTAEYGMLPRSTTTRMKRESFAKPKGRTQEIQRLIGRSLRAVVDLKVLGERTIYLDTDVIQADGGTRTAAITGSFVALHDAVNFLIKQGAIKQNPIREFLAAISAGIINDEILLDLNYGEDSTADVDMNLIMTESGKIVEVQGTSEKVPFTKEKMHEIIDLAQNGINYLIGVQKEALK